MEISNRAIWHEGMCLQPHHFQQQDRYFEKLIYYHSQLHSQSLWGFSRLELDESLLSVGKIGIAKAEGLFQDGAYFNMPAGDDLPKALDLPEGLRDCLLYLVLDARQASVAETGNDSFHRAYRYHMVQREVFDSASDQPTATDITVGSLAARIVTEQEDLSGCHCLPIARISEVRANHHITFDKSFIPPWLNVHQCQALSNFVKEVQTLLTHRSDMLANRLTDTQQAGTSEIVDLMLLQLNNKYEPIFYDLMHRQSLHPETLYRLLLQMMGEMATFTKNQRRPIEPPRYHHQDFFKTFQPIIKEVRHALSMVLEQNATAIPLESREHGLWVGEIHDKQLLNECSFILSAYADIPAERVRTLFPNQIKIAAVEQIQTLVSRGLPGVPIQAIAIAPRQIPYHANFSYFAIDTHHQQWQLLKKSGGLALHVGTPIPGLKLELWAIKG